MNEQPNQPVAAQSSTIQPIVSIPPIQARARRPHKSKITNLTPDVRNFVNQSLYDNVSYRDIIEQLAAKGHPGFTPCNLSRWVKTGYKDWLLQKERVQSL